MRYSTIILTSMAAYSYAQDAELAASLSSQLASLTELGPSIASVATGDVAALQSSLNDLGPSVQSAASAAIASATADGTLDDLKSVASEAEASLKQVFSTLDPGARSSVSSALSAVGLDYASITSDIGGTEATPTANSDGGDAEQTTGSQNAQSTGSSDDASSTTEQEGMAAATAFPIAAIGAGIAMLGLL